MNRSVIEKSNHELTIRGREIFDYLKPKMKQDLRDIQVRDQAEAAILVIVVRDDGMKTTEVMKIMARYARTKDFEPVDFAVERT